MLKPAEQIKGKRIILKKAEKSFKQANISLMEIKSSLMDLCPWLEWATPQYNVESCYEYLQGCEKEWIEGKGFNYMIQDLSGQFMGMISVLNVHEAYKSVEIGYWISTRFARNGYMKEAVKLLEKEFFSLGINRIVIRTDVLNKKSANVPQKLGYHLDGVMRQAGWNAAEENFRDFNIFSKLKSEYQE